MHDEDIYPHISAFLVGHRTLSLSTADAEGSPHAANVQYVSDDAWNLYWVSSPESGHSQHLAGRPHAAVTVYAPTQSPDQIHGLQFHGKAYAMRNPSAIALARKLYEATYPFTADPPYRDAIDRQAFYRFRPTWLRWIDNRRGFGWKYEKTL
ncbi:MAG: pyridoxamine 5'-phosphate oxidase family protein [Phycisphaerales bacterium JB063]